MGLVAIIAVVGILAAIGIVAGMAWGVSHPLGSGKETKAIGGGDGRPTKVIGGPKPRKQLMGANGFSYLDAEAGATGDDIRAVLKPFSDDEVTGEVSVGTCTALDRAEFSRDGIVSLMEREFGRESLTWEKFSVPVEAAFGNIHSNSARIANIVQAFDSHEYRRLQRLEVAGQLSDGDQQTRRLETMSSQLHELQGLAYDNEAMLDELGRLQTELAKLADSHQEVTSKDIAEEVRGLADATRQYMPGSVASIPSNPDDEPQVTPEVPDGDGMSPVTEPSEDRAETEDAEPEMTDEDIEALWR